MTAKKYTLEEAKAYAKRLQNPYAMLSIEIFAEPQTTFDSHAAKKHAYLKTLEDPYATHSVLDEAVVDAQSSTAMRSQPMRHGLIGKLSKKDFRSQCRRIFSQYIPDDEGNTLRSHHRDFIIRNESKSADVRFQLAAQLGKYDLSSMQHIRPRFNRERDTLTIDKLLKIERDISK